MHAALNITPCNIWINRVPQGLSSRIKIWSAVQEVKGLISQVVLLPSQGNVKIQIGVAVFQQRILHTSLLTVYAFDRPRAVISFKHFEVEVGQAISSKNKVTIGEPVLTTLFEAILR